MRNILWLCLALTLLAMNALARDRPDTAREDDTINALQQLMADQKRPSAERYFAVRKALDNGLAPPPHNRSVFLQLYANMATFVGAYDEASLHYNTGEAPAELRTGGFTAAVPASTLLFNAAKDRRAVFFNESHGEVRSRAGIYPMLGVLRSQGFTHLAMETLGTTSRQERTPGSCMDTSMLDEGLQRRGYPIARSGYYTQEPVFGELVREALRLGFELIAYDTYVAGRTIAQREQNQADNLACLLRSNPDLRLVVIGGFSHIAESEDFWVPGGAMAYRFKVATGIDPLTISTTTLLGAAARDFRFPSGRLDTLFTLHDGRGSTYTRPEFDWTVFVPDDLDRDAKGASLLRLNGSRTPIRISARRCRGAFPCLIEARIGGELGDAVAADRCVIHARSQRQCVLNLRSGRFRVRALDTDLEVRSDRKVRVRTEA